MSSRVGTRLGAACQFRAGSAFPQAEQGAKTGDLPFLKVSDLSAEGGGRFVSTANHWITYRQRDRLRSTVVPRGSVLFAKIGEGLRAERLRMAGRDLAIDNNLMAAVPNAQVVQPDYLFFLLGTLGISQYAVGSALPYLKQSTLADVLIDLPNLVEQRAIAEVLGALDDKIAANSRVVAGCEELMRMLVSVTKPRVALMTIVEVARITRSPSDFGAEHVWHYSLPAFDNGHEPAWDIASDIKSAKFVLDRPCVLVSKLNPRFPRVWDISKALAGESFSSTEFVVLHPTTCSTSVLWALLTQTDFRSALQGKVAGTSGSHQRVRPTDLLATEVIDPRAIPAEVQAQVTALGSLTNQLRHESRQLRDVRDALLPHLMSGKLRVRDAEKMIEAVV